MSSERTGDRPDYMAAGPSDATRHANPQLGPEPWFAYPTPTYEELEQELPPYFEQENVSLGVILDRLTTKGYADLRGLLEEA
jgi:mediator of RNA polymerase II transcription subunit 14